MTLKQNLIERSSEIKMKLERELRMLDQPCTISDLMKRIGASRMPIEKHLKALMCAEDFSDIGIVHIGGYDIVFRRVPKAAEPVVQQPEGVVKEVEENARTNDPQLG